MASELFQLETKRASAKIIKELLKYKEKVSGNIKLHEAFNILINEWLLEASVEQKNNVTKFHIFRDDENIYTFEWDDEYDEKDEWNWNVILKEVLEYIISNKLWKRIKTKKRKSK